MSDSEDSHHSQAQEESKAPTEDIRNADVVTKYKMAADIANRVLGQVLAACVPGAKVVDLCALGDKLIVEETDKVFKGKKVSKGVGFPTCVSPNHVVGSFSPLATVETTLAEGDMVSVDLGCQIDGYLSQAAHTIIVGGGDVTGRKADVMAAVFTAADAVVRMMRPGTTNAEITKVVSKTAEDFGVKCIEGVFSHVVKRFEIEGEKRIDNSIPEVPPTGDAKTKACTLEANEVWGIDIVMSTGSGRPKEVEETTTVYRRVVDKKVQLKLKASRMVFSEISKKFPVFPFSMRSLESEPAKVRFGCRNCAEHRLLDAYPVLEEKDGEFVAHVKFTILLLPSGTMRITGLPYDLASSPNVKTEKKPVSDEVLKALSLAILRNKKKKRTAKKKKAAAAAAPAPTEA